MRIILVLFFLYGPAISPLFGQDVALRDSTRYHLVLDSEEQFVGYVMGRRNDSLFFRTTSGLLVTAPVNRVYTLEKVTGPIDVQAFPPLGRREKKPDRPTSSLFLMPTAYTLPAGEVHAGLYEIVLFGMSAGLGGVADIQGGMLFPGIAETYMFGLKFAPLQGAKGAVAFGGNIMGTVYDDDPFGLVYVVGTLALGESWLTAGYMHFPDSYRSGGAIMIGLDLPAAARVRLMAELWIPASEKTDPLEGWAVFAPGARFESEGFWLDLGLYLPVGTPYSGRRSFSGGGFIPYLGGTFIF